MLYLSVGIYQTIQLFGKVAMKKLREKCSGNSPFSLDIEKGSRSFQTEMRKTRMKRSETKRWRRERLLFLKKD